LKQTGNELQAEANFRLRCLRIDSPFSSSRCEGLFVERPKPAPDFMVSRYGQRAFIEAVTVNPSDGEPLPGPTEGPPEMRRPEEIKALLKGKMPIKFGSALYSKLSRKKPYWDLPDVVGYPLIFAIADFHEPQSMTWSSSALFEYLYGVTQTLRCLGRLSSRLSRAKVRRHGAKGCPCFTTRMPVSRCPRKCFLASLTTSS